MKQGENTSCLAQSVFLKASGSEARAKLEPCLAPWLGSLRGAVFAAVLSSARHGFLLKATVFAMPAVGPFVRTGLLPGLVRGPAGIPC